MSSDINSIKEIRKSILEMVHRAKVSHVGAAFSIIEILHVLYSDIMNIKPETVNDPNRDRFVLSKGHASAGLYAVLAHQGFFDKKLLDGYCINDGTLPGHLDFTCADGVEVSAGSLGHGFPLALGMALAAKRKGLDYKAYAIIGDGECNEGSIWETAMIAASLKLDNFTVVIDFNKIQSFGNTNDIIDQSNLAERWAAFGWETIELEDGHDLDSLRKAFNADFKGKPKAIVAHTVKGKGVSYMENKLAWHYKSPSDEQLVEAMGELS